jgi:hypothetical protein
MRRLFPSVKVSASFVGVFLIGALVGGMLLTSFSDMRFSRFLTHTGDPGTMAKRINQKYLSELHLTTDQEARIAPLTAEMTQHLYVTRRQFGVDIMATLDDYHRKVEEQLDPQQRGVFEQENEDRKKRMSAMLLLDQPGVGATDSK